jgi:hypothetical protein
MNRQKAIRVIIFLFAFISFLTWRYLVAQKTNLSREFNGRVENVSYDEKGIPTVTIGGKNYYLNTDYNFKHEIDQGDSIVKYKDARLYRLIKKGSGKVLEFQ